MTTSSDRLMSVKGLHRNSGLCSPTRREAMRGIAAGTLATTLGCGIATLFAQESQTTQANSAQGAKRGFIDAHSHIWTPDVKQFPLAQGKTVEDLVPRSFTPRELLAQARSVGVDRIVLIQHTLLYDYDNRYMLDAAKRFPGTFAVVARINEFRKDLLERMRSLTDRNVAGFRIKLWGRADSWFKSDGMQVMWREGAKQNVPMCLLMKSDALPSIAPMCKKYPDTPVVLDHMGNVSAKSPDNAVDLKMLCDLAKYKQVKVKVSAFYGKGSQQAPYLDLAPMIRRVVEAFGPERLMWGSDCPYQVINGHNYRDGFELIHSRLKFLSETDREWMLRKTAEQTFFS